MGGYQIIDLKNINFVNGTGQTVAGIYALLEANQKVVLLTNIVINGFVYKDTFIELEKPAVSFNGTCYGYKLTITKQDLVTFTKGN